MTIDSKLLEILVCPQNHQPLQTAGAELVAELNSRIALGTVANIAGSSIREPLQAGLVRADSKRLYPIRDGIPILLIDEGIEL